ncbi:MAG: hypothetical protein WCK77_15830 [Verrucomicrobiota bacterium]
MAGSGGEQPFETIPTNLRPPNLQERAIRRLHEIPAPIASLSRQRSAQVIHNPDFCQRGGGQIAQFALLD